MNKEMMNMILKGNLDNISFTEKEKEIALKILNDLEGTLVIRATSILEFCLKAIQYNKVSMDTHKVITRENKSRAINLKTINQMRSDCGLEPIEDGEVILVQSIKNKLP